MDWEKTRGKLANTKDAKGKAQQAPISAWRTFFVANEWNELQSQRRINVPFTIVTMLFFLVGCGWQYHATRTPKMDDLTPAPIDPMLRFVNVAGLWLVIELIQIIFSGKNRKDKKATREENEDENDDNNLMPEYMSMKKKKTKSKS